MADEVRVDISRLSKIRARGGSFYYENSDKEVVAKECRSCKEPVLLTEYRDDKRGLFGKVAKCTPCRNRETREYKRANPEKMQEEWKRYHAENKAAINERARNRREENKEEYLEQTREYYVENRDRILEHKRKWREENRDLQNALVEEWRLRNPDKVRLICQRRRARKASLPDNFTAMQMESTLAYFGGGCALTGEAKDVHWDHVLPISLGVGGTTEGNMIPLRDDLNKRKSASNLFDWFEKEKERSNLSQQRFDKLILFLSEKNGMSPEDYRSFYYIQFEGKDVDAS